MGQDLSTLGQEIANPEATAEKADSPAAVVPNTEKSVSASFSVSSVKIKKKDAKPKLNVALLHETLQSSSSSRSSRKAHRFNKDDNSILAKSDEDTTIPPVSLQADLAGSVSKSSEKDQPKSVAKERDIEVFFEDLMEENPELFEHPIIKLASDSSSVADMSYNISLKSNPTDNPSLLSDAGESVLTDVAFCPGGADATATSQERRLYFRRIYEEQRDLQKLALLREMLEAEYSGHSQSKSIDEISLDLIERSRSDRGDSEASQGTSTGRFRKKTRQGTFDKEDIVKSDASNARNSPGGSNHDETVDASAETGIMKNTASADRDANSTASKKSISSSPTEHSKAAEPKNNESKTLESSSASKKSAKLEPDWDGGSIISKKSGNEPDWDDGNSKASKKAETSKMLEKSSHLSTSASSKQINSKILEKGSLPLGTGLSKKDTGLCSETEIETVVTDSPDNESFVSAKAKTTDSIESGNGGDTGKAKKDTDESGKNSSSDDKSPSKEGNPFNSRRAELQMSPSSSFSKVKVETREKDILANQDDASTVASKHSESSCRMKSVSWSDIDKHRHELRAFPSPIKHIAEVTDCPESEKGSSTSSRDPIGHTTSLGDSPEVCKKSFDWSEKKSKMTIADFYDDATISNSTIETREYHGLHKNEDGSFREFAAENDRRDGAETGVPDEDDEAADLECAPNMQSSVKQIHPSSIKESEVRDEEDSEESEDDSDESESEDDGTYDAGEESSDSEDESSGDEDSKQDKTNTSSVRLVAKNENNPSPPEYNSVFGDHSVGQSNATKSSLKIKIDEPSRPRTLPVPSSIFDRLDNPVSASVDDEDFDIRFAEQYEDLFQEFLYVKPQLLERDPELLGFLKVVKLQKILEASTYMEESLTKKAELVEHQKAFMSKAYHSKLMEASQTKARVELELERDLDKIVKEKKEMQANLTWKRIVATDARAKRQQRLLADLTQRKSNGDTLTTFLPDSSESRLIEKCLSAATEEDLPEEVNRETIHFQVDNSLLLAETRILERQIQTLFESAKKHAWVDSIFMQMKQEHMEKLKKMYEAKMGVTL